MIMEPKPQRIQLKRTKGWRMPPNTVKVTRPGKWGNPWRVWKDANAAECVAKYRHLIANNIWSFPIKQNIQDELRGKNLACWRKPGEPCHADVLLEIAAE